MSVAQLALGHKREDLARSPRLRHPHGPGLQFDRAEAWLFGPCGENGSEQAKWTIEVRPDSDGDLITRMVWRNGERVNRCAGEGGSCAFDAFTEDPGGGHQRHDEVVWPAWPATPQDEAAASPSPLAGVQEYWSTVGNRLRDSAKWTAAVLGAALATVIGTSPLAGIMGHTPQPIAILLGSAGLAGLGITMFLVLQVMRPQSVSYDAVQNAEPRRRWLRELRSTAAMIATVGEYYTLRRRSSWATYGGVLGHLRRRTVRPAGNGSHRQRLRMAAALTPCRV
jgi:hypothetical protein